MLTGTDAGKTLKLWCGQSAALRTAWEDNIGLMLGGRGFTRVYSPYIYQDSLYEQFQAWPTKERPVVDEPIRNRREEDPERDKDCGKNIYLGHKGLNHAMMVSEGQTSYNDFPIRLFEFAEIYTSPPITNDLGLYLSVVCEPGDMDQHCAELYAFIVKSGTHHIRLAVHGIKRGPHSMVQYTAKDGQKHNAGLILARAKYVLDKPKES